MQITFIRLIAYKNFYKIIVNDVKRENMLIGYINKYYFKS